MLTNRYLFPAEDIIDVEVARRLYFDEKFDYQEIDDLGILRLPLREGNESGLLWEVSQRSANSFTIVLLNISLLEILFHGNLDGPLSRDYRTFQKPLSKTPSLKESMLECITSVPI